MGDARVVRVLPDVSGLDKQFDYSVPAQWRDRVAPGDLVRVDLHGRRVPGWIMAVDVEPPAGVSLRPLSRWSSVGPPNEVIELAQWVARRWHGRTASVLRSASPDRMIEHVDQGRSGPQLLPDTGLDPIGDLAAEALRLPGVSVVRTAPAGDLYGALVAAARVGDAVVVAPTVEAARLLGARFRRSDGLVHLAGRDWAGAAGGGLVIGARGAVLSPVGRLAAILVLDEHAETLQEERNPTWHARDVAIERARRAGVPCVLFSPAPSLAALEAADRVLTLSRRVERDGWPPVVVVDRRHEDPGKASLFSPALVEALRRRIDAGQRSVCVLNRTGRSRMLACTSCGELIRTEDGMHLMAEVADELVASTGERRPKICANCAGTGLKRLRLGVDRVRDELEALLRRPVAEVTAKSETSVDDELVVVGTEAVLHRVHHASLVVFLDFDQELLAPRYRAAEEAMALLIHAGRLTGGRRSGSTVLVQTRMPDHRVLAAAVRADPGRFSAEEAETRLAIGFPPFGALAEISGPGAADAVAPLLGRIDLRVLGPTEAGRFLVRADDPGALESALEDLASSKQRVRVAVDPPRV